MSMRLNFILGAKNGSTIRGQGNYQAVTVTLQLLKDLAFQKDNDPLLWGCPICPPGMTSLSQDCQPGLQINPVQQRGCLVQVGGCSGQS